jgi:hypothetical protein
MPRSRGPFGSPRRLSTSVACPVTALQCDTALELTASSSWGEMDQMRLRSWGVGWGWGVGVGGGAMMVSVGGGEGTPRRRRLQDTHTVREMVWAPPGFDGNGG